MTTSLPSRQSGPLREADLVDVFGLDDQTDWPAYALCNQVDPETFFPEKGGSTRDAKRVCMSCTVRAECLEYALGNDERFGIWGGMSERERRRLKNERKQNTLLLLPVTAEGNSPAADLDIEDDEDVA